MFLARIISACFAFAAFIYGLSLTAPTSPHVPRYPQDSHTNRTTRYPPAPVAVNISELHIAGTYVHATDGTEFVFQKPLRPPLGTVLFLHGCAHSATDFFPPASNCPQCIGLPEEVKMTRIALEKRYSVVAVSSTDRIRKCWRTDTQTFDGPDYERVNKALREAGVRSLHSPRLPLFAVGISSGGLFATSLPMRFRVSGVNSIVSGAVSSVWNKESPLRKDYPPHVFTHMGLKDKHTAGRVRKAMDILETMGTPSMELIVPPQSVTTHFLQDSVSKWDMNNAQELVLALQRGGYLDAHFRLLSDPRRSQWRNSVQHLGAKLGDHFRADESALSEELNRAWGSHEITADHFEEALEFLETQLHR